MNTKTTPIPVCNFTIELKILKALSIITSADPRRFPLCGVAIHADGDRLLAVATDGRRIGVVKQPKYPPCDFFDERPLIIPALLIKRTPKAAVDGLVNVSSDGEKITISILGGESVTSYGIEANYPDWRRVIIPEELGVPPMMAFAADVMRGMFDVAKVLTGNKNPGLLMEQFKPSKDAQVVNGVWATPFYLRIQGYPDFFGSLMPIRPDEDPRDDFMPSWISKKEVAQ